MPPAEPQQIGRARPASLTSRSGSADIPKVECDSCVHLRPPLLSSPSVTVVVPTYREVDSLPHLLDRLRDLRERLGGRLDVLLMDDDSGDGSQELVAARAEPWVQFVVRTSDRGLSSAVLDGFQRATGDVLVCMDADLSHPPPAVPHMLDKLAAGADFVIGSRYVEGGSTSDDWGFLRWLNSRVATLMARPLTAVRDPMAGFFAMRRSTFAAGRDFNPVGYKIGLELLVKCRCERVVEVPIHFEDRQYGESKLTLKQQLLYVKHLRRLYVFKYGVWTQVLQFLVVGGLGTIVNVSAPDRVPRRRVVRAGCRRRGHRRRAGASTSRSIAASASPMPGGGRGRRSSSATRPARRSARSPTLASRCCCCG